VHDAVFPVGDLNQGIPFAAGWKPHFVLFVNRGKRFLKNLRIGQGQWTAITPSRITMAQGNLLIAILSKKNPKRSQFMTCHIHMQNSSCSHDLTDKNSGAFPDSVARILFLI